MTFFASWILAEEAPAVLQAVKSTAKHAKGWQQRSAAETCCHSLRNFGGDAVLEHSVSAF